MTAKEKQYLLYLSFFHGGMRIRIRFVLLDPDTFVFGIRIQVQVLPLIWKKYEKNISKINLFHVFEFFGFVSGSDSSSGNSSSYSSGSCSYSGSGSDYRSRRRLSQSPTTKNLYKILPFHSQTQYYFPECLPLLLTFLFEFVLDPNPVPKPES
jgi:hypothetical protein